MHGSRYKINPILDRFFDKVIKTESCWLWKYIIPGRRYGQIRIGNSMVRAHRASYELFVGPIPKGLYVRHKCDNPGCVNPEHLEVGTQKDNMADMKNKNRQSKGSHRPNSLMTESQVLELRSLSPTHTTAELCKKFNIAARTVRSIITRNTWKHI